MTAAKDKGSRWERTVREYLRIEVDPHAYKPHEEGFVDFGDLHVCGGQVIVQAKDWRSWESAIREGLDGAVRQAAAWEEQVRARPRHWTEQGNPPFEAVPVAVVKRARRPVEEAYGVLRLDDLARLLRRAYGP